MVLLIIFFILLNCFMSANLVTSVYTLYKLKSFKKLLPNFYYALVYKQKTNIFMKILMIASILIGIIDVIISYFLFKLNNIISFWAIYLVLFNVSYLIINVFYLFLVFFKKQPEFTVDNFLKQIKDKYKNNYWKIEIFANNKDQTQKIKEQLLNLYCLKRFKKDENYKLFYSFNGVFSLYSKLKKKKTEIMINSSKNSDIPLFEALIYIFINWTNESKSCKLSSSDWLAILLDFFSFL
ncbi:hypothetical protein [Mycoplasma procyoni]|uniref:hypothetical protein n=1 Tax=Mycoplasma procyoni TaxID=568784 RepID=UPI00197BE648|nr:hypothetical protein [Mycoplasma procyoni]MBN3534513.1 hypothetical protein [Mycoplasma procyoni]